MLRVAVGMIKHNCGGVGLTDGLRTQVQKLVDALKFAAELQNVRVHLRDNNKDTEQAQSVLEPFGQLSNLNSAQNLALTGAVTENFKEHLIVRISGNSRNH